MVLDFFFWYFLHTPKQILKANLNFLRFGNYYFSPIFLLKTLFSPWHKIEWAYPKGFNIPEFFKTLISNFFSRLIGGMIRLIFLFFWLCFQIFILILAIFLVLFWVLILPAGVFGIFYAFKFLR